MINILKRKLKKNDDRNLYHCCIQKSGSQWIKKIFSDSRLREKTCLKIYTPDKDFILGKKNREELKKGFPLNTIVSPLYVRYEDFLSIPKPGHYKAFFVMRDPRDLVISRYFSIRYSHNLINESIKKERIFLNNASMEEGLNYFIEAIENKHAELYSALLSWPGSIDNPRIMICKFEDLIGTDRLESFKRIFDHCEISIPGSTLKRILEKYSFEELSQGRKQGEADPKSHYRKGIAGDWQNYFDDNHKKLFKRVAGNLLIELGYEKNDDW